MTGDTVDTSATRVDYTAAASEVPRHRRRVSPGTVFWLALLGGTWAVSQMSRSLSELPGLSWMLQFPRRWEWPVDEWISSALTWLVSDAHVGLFTFREATRAIATVLEAPYRLVRALLIDGWHSGQGQQAQQILPALSWVAVIVLLMALAWRVRGPKLAVLVGACFAYLALFGQWDSAMVTLASVVIAVPIGVLGGLGLGVLAYRSIAVERLLRPLLDLMQTVPVFAYLVPILFLFGFGPVSALVATVIYAMPPMVRITVSSLQSVAPEVTEAGRMAGCTTRQLLLKVLLPTAMPSLMVGVNQVIMLSLNMVIIASMIGAGGLGYDVLTALRRLDIGGGVEAGLAIVVMAIALDRLSQAFSTTPAVRIVPLQAGADRPDRRWLLLLLIVVSTTLAGLAVPALQRLPDHLTLTTGPLWADAIRWVNITLYDTLEAIKRVFLVWLLLPVKGFLVGIPWLWGVLVTGAAVTRIGGWRLGVMAMSMMLFIAANGLWDKAMITLYLCGVSVLVASAIGIPLGLWAGQRPRANAAVGTFIDTLQTLPSFVYLIPVVMLFRVGDFSAMVAVILYSLAPAVRYAAHGVRTIDPALIEAGRVSGCSERQLLWRLRLPLAVPSLLLGLNQTIMLALSMLVITALVGTRDLGQEVYIALTKANTGQGIVAGLSVAFIAIIADRSISALARGARARLGLT